MYEVSEIEFAKRCVNVLELPDFSKFNAAKILKALDLIDTQKKTYYEYSFKIKDNTIEDSLRFLNMDCNAYAWKDQRSFRKRLRLLEQILKQYCQNSKYKEAINALDSISTKPMDLYFGFDVTEKTIIFAYWLILGGVSKSGNVSLVKYDKQDIFAKVLTEIGAKSPKLIVRPILNLGVDITEESLYYKVYYLIEESILDGYSFSSFMPKINSTFKDRKFFYFFSEMYNTEGKLIKEKLFIEFLQDIPNDKDGISYLTSRMSDLKFTNINNNGIDKIRKILSKCTGKVCLISFENDGTMTFYIRSGL